MCMKLLRRLRRKKVRADPPGAPAEVGATVKELQRKLLNSARENGKPRVGA